MAIAQDKEDLLKDEGYIKDFDKDIYVNPNTKKVFTGEAVDDNDIEWLSDGIDDKNNGDWRFYSNNPLSDKNQEEIKKKYTP